MLSRRSPDAVIEPSGNASAAATDSRSGVSALMSPRAGRFPCIVCRRLNLSNSIKPPGVCFDRPASLCTEHSLAVLLITWLAWDWSADLDLSGTANQIRRGACRMMRIVEAGKGRADRPGVFEIPSGTRRPNQARHAMEITTDS